MFFWVQTFSQRAGMQPQPEQASSDELMAAFREGLFSLDELEAKAGEDLRALAERHPETVIRLVDALGGVRLYVPLRLSGDSLLREVLGEAGAQVLVDIYQGEMLVIPRFMRLRQMARRRRIAKLRAAGWSTSRLALHFQLSQRQIYANLRRNRLEADESATHNHSRSKHRASAAAQPNKPALQGER